MSDEFIEQLRNLAAHLPPIETTQTVTERGLEIKFRFPGPPRADGGTLIIPKGIHFTTFDAAP